MISVQEAEKLISKQNLKTKKVRIALAASLGKVLAQDIFAERPQPSFDRATMDGIAINYSALRENKEFPIDGIAKAGSPQTTLKNSSSCLEVMTGAPLPQNADVVIRYEDLDIQNEVASLKENLSIQQFQNIHPKGSDYPENKKLLSKGTRLKSPHLGILASEGHDHVEIEALSVAIISTGDELVPIDETPLPHQIRRSNAHSLQAELNAYGVENISLFHFKDDPTTLYPGLERVLLEHDLIILSGGVSMGKFDLIPSALGDLQVKKIFHKVTQKPGKPLWFGKGSQGQLVFGLPGNPVSSLVCLRRFIIPLFRQEQPITASLAEDFSFKKDLTLFKPVSTQVTEQGLIKVNPINFNTSGDYYSLAESHGFIELPKSQTEFKKGELFPLYLWGNKLG